MASYSVRLHPLSCHGWEVVRPDGNAIEWHNSEAEALASAARHDALAKRGGHPVDAYADALEAIQGLLSEDPRQRYAAVNLARTILSEAGVSPEPVGAHS